MPIVKETHALLISGNWRLGIIEALLLLCLHCLSGAIVRGHFHHSLCGGS
jgi:hypothetical protein